jgi:hypothetical protein
MAVLAAWSDRATRASAVLAAFVLPFSTAGANAAFAPLWAVTFPGQSRAFSLDKSFNRTKKTSRRAEHQRRIDMPHDAVHESPPRLPSGGSL